MPSLTLLGSGVIPRRYIQASALGCETVHAWLGSSALNHVEQSNSVKGLTTDLANYYCEKCTGRPERARHQRCMMMRGYAVEVPKEDDDPIRPEILPENGSEQGLAPSNSIATRIVASDHGGTIQQREQCLDGKAPGSVLVFGGPGLNAATTEMTRGCDKDVMLGDKEFSVGGKIYRGEEMVVLESCRHPDRLNHVVTIFYGLSPAVAATVKRLLFFCGWQSDGAFKDGTVVGRGDCEPSPALPRLRWKFH